ncbi:Protein srek1IP1, partial [Linnemannia exigua]
ASKLSPKVSEEEIRNLFECIGPLDNMILIPSPLGAGYEAIIEFREKDAAFTATHLTGTIFGGRALTITQMDITLPTPVGANNSTVRPFTNMTMQQQQAQQQAMNGSGVVQQQQQQVPSGNPMIRMGATIHHPQFNHPMSGQFPPVYPSPHMTLYNPNIMPPQYHQQQALHQQRLLEQANDPSKTESKTVYVGNLPLTVTKEQLEEVFRDCGVVTRVNITGKATHPTRFAFMDFDTVEAARKALASTDKVIGDRTLRYFYDFISSSDPSLLKKLEELEAGGPLPDMSGITGLSPDLAALNNETASPSAEQPAATPAAAGPPQTAASLLEKLVSSSRRRSRSPSRSRSGAHSSSRRRSRSRSMERDDYYRRSGSSSRRSRRRSHSRSRSPTDSRSRYSRSSRGGYDVDDRDRYESSSRRREREEPSRSSRSSRGHAESSRPRDRDRERERERERERDRDRERHRD